MHAWQVVVVLAVAATGSFAACGAGMCANGGTCVEYAWPSSASLQCLCTAGFMGDACETPVPALAACAASPCDSCHGVRTLFSSVVGLSYSHPNGIYGYEFELLREATLTALGIWDDGYGLGVTQEVVLWDAVSQARVASVDTLAGTDGLLYEGAYRFTNLTAPLVLSAGSYVVAYKYHAGNALPYIYDYVNMSPYVRFVTARESSVVDSDGPVFPNTLVAGLRHLGVSVAFADLSAAQCQCGTSTLNGQNCVASDCTAPAVCKNGGVCALDDQSADTCSCAAQYSGARCLDFAPDACVSNPCQNGATCASDPLTGFTCACPAGFVGDQCEHTNHCGSNPCQAGGTCHLNTATNSYTCTCTPDRTGVTCQSTLPTVDFISLLQLLAVQQVAVVETTVIPEATTVISEPTTVLGPEPTTVVPAAQVTGELSSSVDEPAFGGDVAHGGAVYDEPQDSQASYAEPPQQDYATISEPQTVESVVSSLSTAQRSAVLGVLVTVPVSQSSSAVVIETLSALTNDPSKVDTSGARSSLSVLASVQQRSSILLRASASARQSTMGTVATLLTTNHTIVRDAANQVRAQSIGRVTDPAYVVENLPLTMLPEVDASATGLTCASTSLRVSANVVTVVGGTGLAADLASTSLQEGSNGAAFGAALGAHLTAHGHSCVSYYFNVQNSSALFASDVSSSVVSLGLRNSSLVLPGGNLPAGNEVTLTIQLLAPLTAEDQPKVQCVSWNFDTAVWSRAGCRLLATPAVGDTTVNCACTHMTNFGILFDVDGDTSNSDTLALSILSYTSLALSICATVSVLIIYLLVFPRLQTGPIRLVLLLSAFILITDVVFLMNGALSASVSTSGCVALGALLHYTLLGQFAALFSLGLGFHRLLHDGHRLNGSFILRAVIFTLGLPLLIVGVYLALSATTLGTNPSLANAYALMGSTSTVCFLPSTLASLLLLVLPMALVVVLNLILYARIGFSIHKADKSLPKHLRRKSHTVFISLSLLMGATWIFAVLVVANGSFVAFQYLFLIGNGSLAIFLFVNYSLSSAVRTRFREWRSHRTLMSSSRTAARTNRSGQALRTGSGAPTNSSGHPTHNNSSTALIKQTRMNSGIHSSSNDNNNSNSNSSDSHSTLLSDTLNQINPPVGTMMLTTGSSQWIMSEEVHIDAADTSSQSLAQVQLRKGVSNTTNGQQAGQQPFDRVQKRLMRNMGSDDSSAVFDEESGLYSSSGGYAFSADYSFDEAFGFAPDSPTSRRLLEAALSPPTSRPQRDNSLTGTLGRFFSKPKRTSSAATAATRMRTPSERREHSPLTYKLSTTQVWLPTSTTANTTIANSSGSPNTSRSGGDLSPITIRVPADLSPSMQPEWECLDTAVSVNRDGSFASYHL